MSPAHGDASPFAAPVAPARPAGIDQDRLDECSREPIHIPGAIQPHGALLSVARADLTILQASANASEWLGDEAATLLGRSVGLLDPGLPEALRALSIQGAPPAAHTLPRVLERAGHRLVVTAHVQDAAIILEFEPSQESDPDHAGEAISAIGRLVGAVAATRVPEEVGAAVATAVRGLTGYDRVMIYRFDAEGHGEVIAEAVGAGVESFLGLRYPASDVPAQARAMMLSARVRLIADSGHRAVPLRPQLDPRSGAPLDLGRCALRAVSPVHLEYLRNMRVGASLTAAIVVDGRLWGLVACHHLRPRYADQATRTHLDLVAALLAARLAEIESGRRLDAQLAAARIQQALLADFDLDEGRDWTIDLMRPERLLPLVGAGGAALVHGGSVLTVGDVPDAAALGALRAWLRAEHPQDELVASDALGQRAPALAPWAASASGCLALRLAPGEDDLLIWFRPEEVRTVAWGGDPRKQAAAAGPGQRQSPRQSFAAWQEIQRGRSRAWSVEELAAATATRAHLRGIVRRVYEVRRALGRSNRELAEFAYSAAHDLQEPLRTVGTCVERLELHLQDAARRTGAALPAPAAEYLRMARDGAARGRTLVEDLLEYARIDHDEVPADPVPLADALAEAQALLHGAIDESGAVVEAVDLPTVRGHRRQLIQLFQNLVGNAIKYRSEAPPRVRVAARRRAGAWEVTVTDNGIGIPPEFHERVFGIFKRLHGRAKYAGTGVGLALCRKIAVRHGGRIWVESGALPGSVFHVTLADEDPGRGA